MSIREAIAIVDAATKMLENVLVEYIKQEFTGRITYRNTVIGTYISLILLKGSLIACRGVDGGAIVEGPECSASAMKYLRSGEGNVEVVPLSESEILLDTLTFPDSVLTERDVLAMALLAKPVAEAAPPPVKAEVAVAEECIDPVTLYTILRSSTIVTQIGEAMYSDVIGKLTSIARESKAKTVYASANAPNGKVKILLNVENNKVYIEFEDQTGKTVCASEAVKLASTGKLTNIRIWSS